MAPEELEDGTKAASTVKGAPFVAAEHHSDRQDRPSRHVPTADPSDDNDEHTTPATSAEREDHDGRT